ncbi:DciA family protein [Pseudoxanthobacter sp. M-2]|uniref:DUF721 domain-containing protein n=1 Tax=Pseudoxanthobacter sp. M-2 TaxID=3078754 RepID=UPI0038FC430C
MRREPRPIADLVGRAIDPACRRRGFASSELVTLWPELVGAEVAEGSRPEKLVWPRRRGEAGEGEPATLMVSADGPTALILTHAGPQLVERLNAFLGWRAIARIRVEQNFRPPPPPPVRRRTRPLAPDEAAALAARAGGIANGGLRQAVERLGRAVLSSGPAPAGPHVRPNPAVPSSSTARVKPPFSPAHRGVPT